MKTIKDEELKKIQIDILNVIDEFCENHHIRYFLFAGTLIGAVRHQGYIPWDDDIDICMMREDYERFFSEFNQQESRYHAVCHEDDKKYYLAAGKVIDTKTIFVEKTTSKYPLGVYVDIFPMDYLPKDEKEVAAVNKRIQPFRNMLQLKNIVPVKERKFIKNLALVVSQVLLKPFRTQWILKQIKKEATKNGSERNGNVADISVFTYGMREVFPVDWFSQSTKLLFEGQYYCAPKQYDLILHHMYGDYMKLPPKEKQISHHAFEAYWKE